MSFGDKYTVNLESDSTSQSVLAASHLENRLLTYTASTIERVINLTITIVGIISYIMCANATGRPPKHDLPTIAVTNRKKSQYEKTRFTCFANINFKKFVTHRKHLASRPVGKLLSFRQQFIDFMNALPQV